MVEPAIALDVTMQGRMCVCAHVALWRSGRGKHCTNRAVHGGRSEQEVFALLVTAPMESNVQLHLNKNEHFGTDYGA